MGICEATLSNGFPGCDESHLNDSGGFSFARGSELPAQIARCGKERAWCFDRTSMKRFLVVPAYRWSGFHQTFPDCLASDPCRADRPHTCNGNPGGRFMAIGSFHFVYLNSLRNCLNEAQSLLCGPVLDQNLGEVSKEQQGFVRNQACRKRSGCG